MATVDVLVSWWNVQPHREDAILTVISREVLQAIMRSGIDEWHLRKTHEPEPWHIAAAHTHRKVYVLYASQFVRLTFLAGCWQCVVYWRKDYFNTFILKSNNLFFILHDYFIPFYPLCPASESYIIISNMTVCKSSYWGNYKIIIVLTYLSTSLKLISVMKNFLKLSVNINENITSHLKVLCAITSK